MSRRFDTGSGLYYAINGFALTFLLAPVAIVVVLAFGESSAMAFPPSGFTLKWFSALLASRDLIAAMKLSFVIAALTTIISTLIGTMAALALVRGRLPAATVLTNFLMSPLILPAMLTGLAIFQVLVIADLGRPLWALVLGHTIVTVPYVLRAVLAVLQKADRSVEEAAMVLGAGPFTVFREVTLPGMSAGIISGAVFTFIVSFDQLPISLFLVSPGNETLPIVLFNTIRFNLDGTLAAASVVSILIAMIFVLIAGRAGGFKSF